MENYSKKLDYSEVQKNIVSSIPYCQKDSNITSILVIKKGLKLTKEL